MKFGLNFCLGPQEPFDLPAFRNKYLSYRIGRRPSNP